MDANLALGATGLMALAGSIWALVLTYEKRKGANNGNHASPPAPEPAPIEARLTWPPELAALLTHITERLEGSLLRLESISLPQAPEPPPEWQQQLVEDLESINDRLSEPPEWPPEMVTLFERLCERLDTLQQPAPSAAMAELALSELDKLAVPLTQLPGQLESIFERLSKQVSELLAAERSRPPRPAPPPDDKSTAGGTGGGASPPARRAPPNLPRLNPATLPATPSIPAAYVAGSVFVPGGQVWNLLALIQQQLSPNCPGSAVEFLIAADDSILVGGASTLGGPLTADNYAYELTPSSPPRIYRSSYPGSNTPVGELQVFAPSGGYLHVEVQA